MLVDLLPSEAQPPLRDKFRLYVDSRLEAYRRMPDLVAARAEFEIPGLVGMNDIDNVMVDLRKRMH